MSERRRRRGGRTPLAAALLLATVGLYIWRWLTMSTSEMLRSDFPPTDVAATLIRSGARASLYVDQAQNTIYMGLIGNDHQGDLLYNHAPLTGVLDVPLSMLALTANFRIWSALQFLCLVLATAIAGRAAGRARIGDGTQRWLTWVLPMASLGVLPMLLEGQDVGLVALALAGMYALLGAHRPVWAGLVIGFAVCVGKPHLALGIAAFMLGRTQWRLIVGGALGVALATALTVLSVGSEAGIAFVRTAVRSNGLFAQHGQYGFAGLFSSIFGDGTVLGTALADACIVAALAAAALLGVASRARPRAAPPEDADVERRKFGQALAGAVLLSLVAAPHVYSHDLVLLVPVSAWLLTDALVRDQSVRRPATAARNLGLAWLCFWLVVGVDYVSTFDRIRLTPLAAVALAVLCARAVAGGRGFGWRVPAAP